MVQAVNIDTYNLWMAPGSDVNCVDGFVRSDWLIDLVTPLVLEG